MKVDNILNYLNDIDTFLKIGKEIYEITKDLTKIYPEYKDWFFNKQLKECFSLSRNIIFIRNNDNKIIALTCLKNNNYEKKICTLFVDPDYRNNGLGSLLFEEAIFFLKTTTPVVTFTEDKLWMFDKFIKKYDWKLTDILENNYKDNAKELVFNGKNNINIKDKFSNTKHKKI